HGEFCKIETKAGNRMQREKMPGMRRTTRTAPAAGSESIQNSPILDNAIAERNIELQRIAVRPQTAVAEQVAGVIGREQVLANGQRHARVLRKRSMRFEIERID